MIIVSQDKKAIHNFDNVLSLQIEPTLKEYSIEVSDAINDGSSLGIYSSEERAKEVLQEITEKICEGSNIKMDIEGINCEVSKQIYYMPER